MGSPTMRGIPERGKLPACHNAEEIEEHDNNIPSNRWPTWQSERRTTRGTRRGRQEGGDRRHEVEPPLPCAQAALPPPMVARAAPL
jgi:hypothetical protein